MGYLEFKKQAAPAESAVATQTAKPRPTTGPRANVPARVWQIWDELGPGTHTADEERAAVRKYIDADLARFRGHMQDSNANPADENDFYTYMAATYGDNWSPYSRGKADYPVRATDITEVNKPIWMYDTHQFTTEPVRYANGMERRPEDLGVYSSLSPVNERLQYRGLYQAVGDETPESLTKDISRDLKDPEEAYGYSFNPVPGIYTNLVPSQKEIDRRLAPTKTMLGHDDNAILRVQDAARQYSHYLEQYYDKNHAWPQGVSFDENGNWFIDVPDQNSVTRQPNTMDLRSAQGESINASDRGVYKTQTGWEQEQNARQRALNNITEAELIRRGADFWNKGYGTDSFVPGYVKDRAIDSANQWVEQVQRYAAENNGMLPAYTVQDPKTGKFYVDQSASGPRYLIGQEPLPDNAGDADISDELTVGDNAQEQKTAPAGQQPAEQDDYQYATKPMSLAQKARLVNSFEQLKNKAMNMVGIPAESRQYSTVDEHPHAQLNARLNAQKNPEPTTLDVVRKGAQRGAQLLGKEIANNITPYELKSDTFNRDPWKKLTTDAQRDAYLASQMQPFIASRMMKAKLSGEKNLPAMNDTAGWLRYIRQNEDAKKQFAAAFQNGDMGFVEYMQRLEQRANSPDGLGFKNESLNIWQSLTKEEQDEFRGYMQSAVWNNIKADWFNNIPKAVGLWLRSFGWNGAGDFAANPLYFYGSLALAFVGGSMLLEGQDEDDEPTPRKKRNAVYDAIMNSVPYGG